MKNITYFFEGKILIFYILVYAIFLILYGIRRRRSELLLYTVFGILFGIYLYILIKVTQFPVFQTPGMEETLGGNIWRSINLIPFKDIINLTSLYNIIMTVPMGFFIPLLSRKKITTIKKIMMFLLPGFLIELSQLIQLLLIGYTLRTIDINDIICNAIGVVIGYMFFCISCAVNTKKT